MSLFFAIIFSILACEFVFWWWAARAVRPMKRSRMWSMLLHGWMAVMFGGFLAVFVQRLFRIVADFPAAYLATVYLWHMLVLPLSVLGIAVYSLVSWVTARTPSMVTAEDAPPGPTRRQMLVAGAVAVPPLLTGVSVTRGLMQLDNFRVREIEIPLADLPADLDGLTIAHVTDCHVGRFTFGQKLRNIAEVTNSLRADLVLMTGDLIDYSLTDLPVALDMVRRMDPRFGLFMCQGNHDLFQGRDLFDAHVRAAGVPLLVNESARVQVRGSRVQILGARWGNRDDKDASVHDYVARLAAMRDPAAFPILLAHHPHAFDPAAAYGLPLTLAGHTHGGQLMLTARLGAGPMMYRYWSGLYRSGRSAAVVSNGVGNWFPLRTNAPAEIVKITLRHLA